MQTTIQAAGLFGTCGNSVWRDAFIEGLNAAQVSFFNPVVPNWTPECAAVEAENLAKDNVLVFAVTDETYAVASLAEVGVAAAHVIKARGARKLVVYVAPKASEALQAEHAERAKDSFRARTLLLAHLKALDDDSVQVADSLEDLLARTIAASKSP